ncbi:RNA polymerase sigma factor [Oceanobacillus halophilus]|uniref:Sigma-70 family RNA polymerase sigma factor n=1 Tax=Oceanobacillus halophilus TaxID=930130 RepID=A0A495A557_9BACI|nr:sigma-70 family RNA polymerase sigma factor [Oceanobacillus halophilus]RKQ34243.1 sigma-70 family RNA polymerase sigma factor [Oceanobacillus halophilus]
MEENDKDSFEEIFEQNKGRIYFQLKSLGIHDPLHEYYTEGLYAMWMAYKKYEPTKGPMSTYFNFSIRNHLIDTIRKDVREQDHKEKYAQNIKREQTDGNHVGEDKQAMIDPEGIVLEDRDYWEKLLKQLTVKQKKWVYYCIVKGWTYKEIAEKEGTTVHAVKDWGKQARKKLRERIIE